MTKSTFVGTVRSSTILQGTQEVPYPPVLRIISRQIPIWAVELRGACEMVLNACWLQSRNTWNALNWADTHWWDILCRSPGLRRRNPSTPLHQNQNKTTSDFGHISKRSFPTSSLSSRQHLEKKAGDPFHGRKERGESECPTSPAVWDAAKETHLSNITQSIKAGVPRRGWGLGWGEEICKDAAKNIKRH